MAVSVRNLTFRPCAARWRVNAVDSRMPLNSLGENTSNVSDTVDARATRPRLLSAADVGETHFDVSNRVNWSRKMPGTLTESFAKMHNAPGNPSSCLSFSGVWMASPAVASAPVGVLTASYRADNAGDFAGTE
jgi:hypothetical protein